MDERPTVWSLYSFFIALCMRLNRTLMVAAAPCADLFNLDSTGSYYVTRSSLLNPFSVFPVLFFSPKRDLFPTSQSHSAESFNPGHDLNTDLGELFYY